MNLALVLLEEALQPYALIHYGAHKTDACIVCGVFSADVHDCAVCGLKRSFLPMLYLLYA